jgi:hypothetical protein
VVIELRCAGAVSGVAVRSLWQWLAGEPELRGRVDRIVGPPRSGELGGTVETLAVALGPGGVVGVLASALVSWVRRQRGDQTVEVTRPDGTKITVTSTHVRGLTAEATQELVRELAAGLGEGAQGDE